MGGAERRLCRGGVGFRTVVATRCENGDVQGCVLVGAVVGVGVGVGVVFDDMIEFGVVGL